MNTIEEAYSLVIEAIRDANTQKAHNKVLVGVCRRKDTGELFTQVQDCEIHAIVKMLYRHKGASHTSRFFIQISIPGIYEDEFCYGLSERTIRAKTAKAIEAWNDAASNFGRECGPYIYRTDNYDMGRKYELVSTYCMAFEQDMAGDWMMSWQDYTYPLLLRAYMEFGAVSYGYESRIAEDAKKADL